MTDNPIHWGALALSLLIALAGGLVRGVTGFGGGLVMTLPLAYVLGPQIAVPAMLLLEAFAAAPMVPAAIALARFRVIVPICVAAAMGAPIGVTLLVGTDPQLLRRLIAAIVILFSLLLLKDFRLKGPHRLATSIALGASSGVLVGAVGIGGPPIIIYLLSGPDPIAITRANLTLCTIALSVAALAAMAMRGAVGWTAGREALLMAPLFYGGVMIGARLFPLFDERRFRRFTLLLLASVSTVLLFL